MSAHDTGPHTGTPPSEPRTSPNSARPGGVDPTGSTSADTLPTTQCADTPSFGSFTQYPDLPDSRKPTPPRLRPRGRPTLGAGPGTVIPELGIPLHRRQLCAHRLSRPPTPQPPPDQHVSGSPDILAPSFVVRPARQPRVVAQPCCHTLTEVGEHPAATDTAQCAHSASRFIATHSPISAPPRTNRTAHARSPSGRGPDPRAPTPTVYAAVDGRHLTDRTQPGGAHDHLTHPLLDHRVPRKPLPQNPAPPIDPGPTSGEDTSNRPTAPTTSSCPRSSQHQVMV